MTPTPQQTAEAVERVKKEVALSIELEDSITTLPNEVLQTLLLALSSAQSELAELGKDKERLDAAQKQKWNIFFNPYLNGFAIQSYGQVLGNIANNPDLRSAIDSAMQPTTKSE